MDKSIFNFQPAGKKSILLSGTKREKYKNSFEMTEKMLVGKQSELGWETSASWATLYMSQMLYAGQSSREIVPFLSDF